MPGFNRKSKTPKSLNLAQTSFSKSGLLFFAVIFAAIGSYIIIRSFAAGTATSKTWDTDTDLNAGTLSSLAVSGTGNGAKLQLNSTTTSSGDGVPTGPASLYITPTGSDSNNCTQSSPCKGFDRAYHVATAGQIVDVAAGSYSGQTMTVDATKQNASSDVVFRANGAVNVTGELLMKGYHFEIDNMTIGDFQFDPGASNITLRNINSTYMFINSAHHISIYGGTIDHSDSYVANGNQIKVAANSTEVPSDILIQGVTFANFRKDPATSNHVDCLHISAGDRITLRGNTTINCETYGFLFTNGGIDNPSDLLIENNFSYPSASSTSTIGLGGGHGEVFNNFMIRYNSISDMGVGSDTGNTLSNVVIDSNNIGYMNNLGCSRSGVTYSHNIVSNGGACGGQLTSNGFVSSTDYHLAAGSAAIGYGNVAAMPSLDIDGQSRPAGGTPDAGADEFGATAPGGTTTTYSTTGTAIYTLDSGSGNTSDWTGLTDSQTLPTGTSVTLESRSSADNSTWSAWATGVASTPDNRYIQVRATLGTTNSSVTPSIDNITLNYTVSSSADTTAPTVSLTAPATGATVKGSAVTVSASAADNVGVSGVQFKLDGVNLQAEDTASPYSITWDSTGATNASHILTAVARDAAGNTTTSSIVTVTVSNTVAPPVDTTAPSTPTGLANGATTTTTVSLTWNASTDNSGGSGMAGYKIYRNGTQIATSSLPNYTDTGLTASTSYSYAVASYDNAGNTSNRTSAVSAKTADEPVVPPPPVDTTPPSVTYKVGDFNHDGRVDILDLSSILTRYGRTDASYDLNNSGKVDIIDLSIFLSHYGK